jgi:serine/tyrosine/threonine adenylyltransferase
MLNFKNKFTESLPADPILENATRQVSNCCFSLVEPTATKQPALIASSQPMLQQLGLSSEQAASDEFRLLFSGNLVQPKMKPYAMCYGGHQFGHWAGQLGDGRAINLGEVEDIHGQLQTLQLKGAGPTPYSRTADGLAVLRSSVREFLCSEAMHGLGIATTRALSLSLTGDQVMRDMFYDGHAQLEPGAVVCRVAESFLRFGNYQIHAARNEIEILKQLADYTIEHHFPEIQQSGPEKYEAWFEKVCQTTCSMIVDWMRVGFVHGVMNTDNLSILGLTIDYGPYGWLEGYDPMWTPNTTDAQGKRYSYGNQPQIAQWNLFQLANALAPLAGRVEQLEASLQGFADRYTRKSQRMYANKLGLKQYLGEPDQILIDKLFEILQLTETDMTIFFRCLSKLEIEQELTADTILQVIEPALYSPDELKSQHAESFIDWVRKYQVRVQQQSLINESRIEMMNSNNPKYILRNYLVQVAIEKAEKGDYSEIETLLELCRNPYDEQNDFDHYANKRPDWARNKAGCSMLSCSS